MTRKEFIADLEKLGVKKGMNLLVHSSLKRMGSVEGGPETVIDCLREAIGTEGTLLFPALTYDIVNAKQPVFHVKRTPSSVGYLTNLFRQRPEAVRSLHPTHSIAALGPKAQFFTQGQLKVCTPCPSESPLGRLMRNEGWILFLGVNLSCNTTFHALEEEALIPGLLTEEPEQLFVIDEEDVLHETPHYRHAMGFLRYYLDMEHILHQTGALVYGKTGKGISRLVNAVAMREIVLPILRKEPELLICREKGRLKPE